MQGISFEDAGDNCLCIEDGRWEILNSVMHCGHGSALTTGGRSIVKLSNTFLGGRGKTEIKTEVHGNFHQATGGLQEAVITRHSCYGVPW